MCLTLRNRIAPCAEVFTATEIQAGVVMLLQTECLQSALLLVVENWNGKLYTKFETSPSLRLTWLRYRAWPTFKLHELIKLTLILLTWRIWWAPNNASKCQVGFNSAFKWSKWFVCSNRWSVIGDCVIGDCVIGDCVIVWLVIVWLVIVWLVIVWLVIVWLVIVWLVIVWLVIEW